MISKFANHEAFGSEVFAEMDRILKEEMDFTPAIEKKASLEELKTSAFSNMIAEVVKCAEKLEEIGHPAAKKANDTLAFMAKFAVDPYDEPALVVTPESDPLMAGGRALADEIGDHEGEMAGEEEKQLIIMRGVSGSGKSTMANKLTDGDSSKIFSTDEFFMEEGNYNFDPSKLGEAHQWNQDRVRDAMKQGVTPIVVDNTHTQKWEARPYVQMALENNYKVKAVETEAPWRMDADELAKRNVHGVPREAIERMIERYEPHETFTEEEILKSKAPWEK